MSLEVVSHPIREVEEHVYFCAPSPDEKHIACALGNGTVCILNSHTLEIVGRGAPGKEFMSEPATCVRWSPPDTGNSWQLVSCSSVGGVMLWQWNPPDGSLQRGIVAQEGKNEVMTVDVSPSGHRVISAGSDRVVRLYDAKLTLLAEMTEGLNHDGSSRSTHTSRIFSARFVTDYVAISAGWESPLQVWDLHTYCSNKQVCGLHGSFDCLEVLPGTHLVVVASPHSAETLQIVDSVTVRLLEDNSKVACSQLDPSDRVILCRISPETGYAWCLTSSPSSMLVISLSSGMVLSRIPLASHPLNMCISGSRAFAGCKNGVLLEMTLNTQ